MSIMANTSQGFFNLLQVDRISPYDPDVDKCYIWIRGVPVLTNGSIEKWVDLVDAAHGHEMTAEVPLVQTTPNIQFEAVSKTSYEEQMILYAERYKFLRSLSWDGSAMCVVWNPKQNVRLGTFCPSDELLDSKIDELRNGQTAMKPYDDQSAAKVRPYDPLSRASAAFLSETEREAVRIDQQEVRPFDEPPSKQMMWLVSHCKAIGMVKSSDSGLPEHDVALFTTDLRREISDLKKDVAELRMALEPFAVHNSSSHVVTVEIKSEAVQRAREVLLKTS